MAQLPFNASEVPDDQGFTPLKPDNYLCQVISSEIKPTKKGDGTILKLTSQVMDGPYTGRLIFDNLNISNPNAEAERISQRTLADLCLAVGLTVINDSEELHFKPFIGRVGIRHDKNNAYPPQNTIRYTAREGTGAPQQVQQQVPWEAQQKSPPPQQQPQVQRTPVRPPPTPTPTGNGGNKPWNKPQPRY